MEFIDYRLIYNLQLTREDNIFSLQVAGLQLGRDSGMTSGQIVSFQYNTI